MVKFAALGGVPVGFRYFRQEMYEVLRLSIRGDVDLALDLDVDGNKVEDLTLLATFLATLLQTYLGSGYDVINESNHVHVEFDVIN